MPSSFSTAADRAAGLPCPEGQAGGGALPAVRLDGRWQFALDPDDRGRRERWFARRAFPHPIRVPGAWQAQGFGGAYRHAIAQVGHPALQVERTGYRGTAWYRTEFTLPDAWRGRRVWLTVGGVHPRAEFWCNGRLLGTDPGGLLEFRFDLTPCLRRAGRPNALAVRIFEHGRDWSKAAEGGIDNFATTWSGLYRGVGLAATGDAWIEYAVALPDLRRRAVRIEAALRTIGAPPRPADVELEVTDPDGRPAAAARRRAAWRRGRAVLAFDLPLARVVPWSLEAPRLYAFRVRLRRGDERLDERADRFGLRDLAARGRRLMLNGRPLFLRGFGFNAVFPRTLSPDLDPGWIRKQVQTARAYGFNGVDWYGVPYREFLDAADEQGLLVQIFPGDLAGGALERRDHLTALIRQTLNHPCVMTHAWSAERYDNPPGFVRALDRLYTFSKRLAPTRLVLARDGAQLRNVGRGRTDVEELACCYRACYSDALLRNHTRRPVLLHELGWFSSYPNPALKPKYRGLPLRPFHIEYAERVARREGVARLLPAFVRVSERLQALERKIAVEAARRVPAIAGFHLWMGHDTVSAVEGVWDDFGDPKNVSARECQRYNGDTVLLMRQDFRGRDTWVVPPDNVPETNPHDICRDCQGRTLWEGETLTLDLSVSHFGAAPLRDAVLDWDLTAVPAGRPLAAGRVAGLRAARGAVRRLATLRVRIPTLGRATKLVLRATFRAGGVAADNAWDFWGFPRALGLAPRDLAGVYGYGKPARRDYGMDHELAGIVNEPFFFERLTRVDTDTRLVIRSIAPNTRLIVSRNAWSNGLVDFLEAGGRVWLLTERLFPEYIHRYRSIPWNSMPFGNAGLLVRRHPALGRFPHDGFGDLQWYDLARTTTARRIEEGGAVNLDLWPGRIEPIVRSVDSYMGARRRGLLFEARVGRGRLMVSRLNFVRTPAAQCLAGELVRYLVSAAAAPRAAVPARFLRRFVQWG